jgi:predicted TIM-barrel fold metal-dependent hydrolase
MKIDIFTHIHLKNYMEMLAKKARLPITQRLPPVTELSQRFQWMDKNPDVVQVITVPNTPSENLVSPEDNIALMQLANDEMAELVAKYPERFIAAAACLPLNNIDASLRETERAITQLHMRGVQIFTHINGEPLSTPKFKPLYELMAKYDLPIWIHPQDPPGWGKSPFENQLEFGWLFHTSVAMLELSRAGILEAFPNIKFITHHCGGMVPYNRLRVRNFTGSLKKFYADTAIHEVVSALMCGYDYFGADHIVFGTDMPWYDENAVGNTIRAVEAMAISAEDKQKIFESNARKLMKLPAK